MPVFNGNSTRKGSPYESKPNAHLDYEEEILGEDSPLKAEFNKAGISTEKVIKVIYRGTVDPIAVREGGNVKKRIDEIEGKQKVKAITTGNLNEENPSTDLVQETNKNGFEQSSTNSDASSGNTASKAQSLESLVFTPDLNSQMTGGDGEKREKDKDCQSSKIPTLKGNISRKKSVTSSSASSSISGQSFINYSSPNTNQTSRVDCWNNYKSSPSRGNAESPKENPNLDVNHKVDDQGKLPAKKSPINFFALNRHNAVRKKSERLNPNTAREQGFISAPSTPLVSRKKH